MQPTINSILMKLPRRAEVSDSAKLVTTFVNIGPLFALMSSLDHQVIYGRRGTGKTHALTYLAETVRKQRDVAVVINMQTIGSSGGIYSDPNIDLAERATRLLVDTLAAIHDKLLDFAIEYSEKHNLAVLGPILDEFGASITEVKIVGNIETSESLLKKNETQQNETFGIELDTTPMLRANAGLGSIRTKGTEYESSVSESGKIKYAINFGSVRNSFEKFSRSINGTRIWILLDEWSDVPLDLQPYLADLLRRTVFPVQGTTVKIAAIEQRTNFKKSIDGRYIGFEVGADIAADINLDDFMVFENDSEKAQQFFSELVFRHFDSLAEGTFSRVTDANSLIQESFTQRNVFGELVRAAGGVPRDAFNILILAALSASESSISMIHLRQAARNWYLRDKERAVDASQQAHLLLHWIIDKVIRHRKTSAFLLRSDIDHRLINDLFDARVLHILKKDIATNHQPGVRYIVYKLDYGCYINLTNTQAAPQRLLPFMDVGDEQSIDVPTDDYRSIRRAILELSEFEQSLTPKAS
jgi:hypothetical protein